MLDFLIVLTVGWPAILASVIIMLVGLFRKDHRFLVAAGIIAIPYSWIWSGYPNVRNLMFMTPLLLLIAAWTMSHKWEMVSWIFAIPFLLIILLLASVTLAGAA